MIHIKTPDEIEKLRIAGKIVGDTHNYLKPFNNYQLIIIIFIHSPYFYSINICLN